MTNCPLHPTRPTRPNCPECKECPNCRRWGVAASWEGTFCPTCLHERVKSKKFVPGLDVGRKDDAEKSRMDLVDAYAMEELAKVLSFGAKKYAEHNWRKGIVLSRLLAALLRHTYAMMRREDTDEETGLPHAAHAMCCCMFILWTMKHRPDMDDRYHSKN